VIGIRVAIVGMCGVVMTGGGQSGEHSDSLGSVAAALNF
jgi:hypothetical protein